jgi:hypothetical protein
MIRYMSLSLALLAFAPLAFAAEEAAPKIASSRVVAVTVYPNNALITREVDVPAGGGSIELVVNPLPEHTVNSSLYSEGIEGIRVLTTRYRMRPVREDRREEVRKLQAQIKTLHQGQAKLQSEMQVIDKNLAMLAKLEDFTSSSLKSLTEKGLLNGDAIITLSKYVMDSRAERSQALVTLRQEMADNQEQMEFLGRKLNDLTAGTSKVERDAVIVVDKKEGGVGKVRLHYLVDAASWHPLYKLRAGNGKAKDGKAKEKVTIEYLAAVVQQSGEEWGNVEVTLSTAQPMLNAAPPDLKVLAVSVMPRHDIAIAPNAAPGGGPQMPRPAMQPNAEKLVQEAQKLRKQSQDDYNLNKQETGVQLLNSAAALEQTRDLLVHEQEKKATQIARGEGPSVTYHLSSKLSIPSRNDEQVIEIARVDVEPEYYYKAVPVLTNHVYRLANLTNTTKYVLLPGEATMYIGSDFVGRAELPLVAVGEQFTAGFGVDPQLQVQRQLLDKNRTNQGDNQVWKYEYRILISSYKSEPVKLQLWDRLPHADNESVAINLGKPSPALSADPLYIREERTQNLLRWDLTVEPTHKGDKALAVNYDFKLELGKAMTIQSFSTTKAARDVGIHLPGPARPPEPPRP